jgi:hypothetical protein
VLAPAGTSACFFDRLTSVIIRSFGSPKMPRIRSSGRKPANRFVSRRRFRLFEVGIGKSCQLPAKHEKRSGPIFTGAKRSHVSVFAHTIRPLNKVL